MVVLRQHATTGMAKDKPRRDRLRSYSENKKVKKNMTEAGLEPATISPHGHVSHLTLQVVTSNSAKKKKRQSRKLAWRNSTQVKKMRS
jgi:hypothetical protein